MSKINGLEYINRSTTRTSCRPNGHPQPHTHHTVHRTSVGSITNTTIATTHTHTHTHNHTPTAPTSQHRSVPINNKYIRAFNLHSQPPIHQSIHPSVHPRIYIYCVVCVPYNHIHTKKQINKSTTRWLS